MAFVEGPQPGVHLRPGMYELNEAVMCRRRAQGDTSWNWNVGVVAPPLPPGVEVPVSVGPIVDGEMQAFALTLDKFLDHAAKWRPDGQVVTAREGGRIDRVGYADLRDRSLRVSSVLAGLGVRKGDRVATLAWNTQDHVEVWFAIMGMGAVCHTLNPRLTAEQLAAMVVQSEARV
jgi:non-ribosomal peptide synthetase component F